VADEYGVRNLYHRHAQLCGQLTALQAERDALSVWCQAADDVAAEMKRERDALAAQLTAVEAERDRLRELVREELEAYYKWPNLGVTGRGRDWFTRARAALGEAKP
jgi:vacuolar-type H+-ATPase subunit D/Vma8